MTRDFITDDELRANGVSELDIDALDRDPATQKFANFSRDREAVEEVLRTRRSGKCTSNIETGVSTSRIRRMADGSDGAK